MDSQEFVMSTKVVEYKADLAIGADQEGRIRPALKSETEIRHFGDELARHTARLTVINSMDCMDDRPTIELGDGTSDPAALRERIAPQWAGGLVLATAKAAVAANADYLRDAKNFQDAYLKTYDLLISLGYQDGGHAGCGASKLVEDSVASPVAREIALPSLAAVMEINDQRTRLFDVNALHKQQLLDSGFYSGWDPAWHEDFLTQKAPQNFSRLKTAEDAVHGHYAKGVYAVVKEGYGFAKNAFYEDTGEMSFGVTLPIVQEVAFKVGGSDSERDALLVGFGTDLLDVSDKLVAPGLPLFIQAA